MMKIFFHAYKKLEKDFFIDVFFPSAPATI